MIVGDWRKERDLGSGGFGIVSLWINDKTHESIAIKKVKHAIDLKDKQKERWQSEINIMLKLNHPNVIRSIKVPVELNQVVDGLSPMGMEYCEKGSLREMLVKPENVCGLRETMVRGILHDVTAGVEYLHKNKIVHRDLKPDNIVLTAKDNDTRVVYKIIDLGYAKEVNSDTSLCYSLVGTMQYLAPELLDGHSYTSTVDYWSFGTLLFECITGRRPFMNTVPVVQWHKQISEKCNEDICTCLVKGHYTLCKTITLPHHLTRPTQLAFENWLRLMLHKDPKSRGGARVDKEERPKCFQEADLILQQKIVNVQVMGPFLQFSYSVSPGSSLGQLIPEITKDTEIPPEHQLLFLDNGRGLDSDFPITSVDYSQVHEPITVFLFNKTAIEARNSVNSFPEYLQELCTHDIQPLKGEQQRSHFVSAIHFVMTSVQEYNRLSAGRRAALLAITKASNKTDQRLKHLNNEILRFYHYFQFMKSSVQVDLRKIKEYQGQAGLNTNDFGQKWKKEMSVVNQSHSLENLHQAIKVKDEELKNMLVDLNSGSNARGRNSNELADYEKQALQLYSALKQDQRADKGKNAQQLNRQMQKIVNDLVLRRDLLLNDLRQHICKIIRFRGQLCDLEPEVERLITKVHSSIKDMEKVQEKRQSDIWEIVTKPPTVTVVGNNGDNSIDAELSECLQIIVDHDQMPSLQVTGEMSQGLVRLQMATQGISPDSQPQSYVSKMDWSYLTNARKFIQD